MYNARQRHEMYDEMGERCGVRPVQRAQIFAPSMINLRTRAPYSTTQTKLQRTTKHEFGSPSSENDMSSFCTVAGFMDVLCLYGSEARAAVRQCDPDCGWSSSGFVGAAPCALPPWKRMPGMEVERSCALPKGQNHGSRNTMKCTVSYLCIINGRKHWSPDGWSRKRWQHWLRATVHEAHKHT